MARDTWYRLDNIGKFYSSQAGSNVQTVFRFSATLVDEVDATILQHAVDATVEIFPNFNVCLRSGVFWHYLEQAEEPPVVHPENLPICFGLHVDAKSILFRVSYYQCRINLEVSHIVSDGRGTTSFFKALLYAYLQERYSINDVAIEYDGSDHQKSEISFDKYYERGKTSSLLAPQGKAESTKKTRVHRLAGWRDQGDATYMEYHLPTQDVKDLARSFGVSMTSLAIAALMCAIRAEMPRRHRNREIRIGVPVDLRDIFSSATTKNFFGLTFVSYVPEDDIAVQDLAVQVQSQLERATTAEHLQPRMNRMINLEKNFFLRFAPLFLKDLAIEIGDRISARETTTTVSNLGRIGIDERLSPFIKDINVLTSTTGINFVLCSFGNDLSIGISSVYANLDIIKHFCRYFSAHGIKGQVNFSKTSEEVAADWREVRLETSMKRLSGQAALPDEVPDTPQADEQSGTGHEAL